jgi:beta-glucosidase-like glycosyl hydrolase
MHAHRELITGVLKRKIGFDGFVISDWEGVHQLPGDYAAQVRAGVNAGIDMFMEPFSYQAFETTLLAEVAAGRVSEARIDDAVRRILVKKFQPVRAPLHRPAEPGRGRLARPPGPGPQGRGPVPGAAEEPGPGPAPVRP